MIQSLLLGAALLGAAPVLDAAPTLDAAPAPIAAAEVSTDLPSGNRELGWDKKHRVWMFDSRQLLVYEVDSDGLGEAREIKSKSDPPHVVVSSTMGEDPEDWMLFSGNNRVRLFLDGEEAPAQPLDWYLSSVAYFDGKLAAFALPVLPGEPLGDVLSDTPPWLLVLEDGAWETEIEGEFPEDVVNKSDPLMSLQGHLLAHTSKSQDRGLWLSDAYRHRVRYLSHTGRFETTLTVGDQAVEWIPWPESEVAEFKEKFGVEPSALGRLRRSTKCIAEGRDGRVYVLGSADALDARRPEPHGDLALYRFDPVLLAYESAEIKFSDSAPVGRLQMAPGRDGLFILDYLGTLHFVAWETLDAADWEHVQGAELDGYPLGLRE